MTTSKAEAEANRKAKAAAANRARNLNPRLTRSPSTSARYYDDDETEFILAVKTYQEQKGVRFPTLCELLAIVRELGYTKGEPCSKPS